MCVYCVENVLTDLTYIALNPLEILTLCVKSIDIDSIECIRDHCLVLTVLTYIVLMVWLKSFQSQLFKTFCQLEIG